MHSEIRIRVDQAQGTDVVEAAAREALAAAEATGIKVLQASYSTGNPKMPNIHPLELTAESAEPEDEAEE